MQQAGFDWKQWRKAERARLLAERESVPDEQRQARNAAITDWLRRGFSALAGRPIGFCWPYRGEPDARFFLREMRDGGSRCALPIVVAKQEPLEFRAWWPGAPTLPGVFDLPIPQGTERVVPEALLVPPIGFDAHGYRLGYGGGYFDRTLAAMRPQPLKIGIAFELSRIETIHPQPHDIPLDCIVTESGVEWVTGSGLLRVDPGEVAARVERSLARA
jgi:5,10-methenyltetrahydrofolate synthetase